MVLIKCFFFLQEPTHELCIKGSVRSQHSAEVLGHLKIVEVKCTVADKKVFKILKYLGTLGISKRINSEPHIHACAVFLHMCLCHTQTNNLIKKILS